MDSTEQQPGTAAPSDAEPRPATEGGKRERKPPSEAQAKKAAASKRLKRQMEKLLTSGDLDALEAAALALDGGKASAAPAASEDTAPAEEKKPAAPGPTPEESAAFLGLSNTLVGMLAAPLTGTAYDMLAPRPDPMGGGTLIPAQQLTQALAPVLAKYLPAAITTPEGQLVAVMMMWLGPPLMATARAKLAGGDETTGAAGVAAA